MRYDPLYVQFIYYFNIERDYFECHEVMEALWMEEARSPLYQGLLQVAVGLYHFRNGNIDGAIKLFTAGIDKLNGAKDARIGINLSKLLKESEHYLEKLSKVEQEPFEFYDLDIEIQDEQLAALVEEYRHNPPSPEDEH
jgi:predicted metal-dependent hydrolase